MGALLTRREREVVGLLSMGKSNKEICDALQLKLPTVTFHLRNIFQKLRVANRTQAVYAANEMGFVTRH